MLLGCIADDYTGATDLASSLSDSGMRVVQIFGVPDPATPEPPDADAVVVALKTRTTRAGLAVEQSLASLHWLTAAGAETVLFKYCSTFDSTAQGNIGPVHDALMTALGQAQSISTPATPDNGRTVYQGYLFIGERLLSESGMRNHPLTPMTDSNLPRVLQAQTSSVVAHLPLAIVRQGPSRIRLALAELRATTNAPQIVICDAIDDSDLRSLAEATRDLTIVAGGAGLGRAMASVRVSAPRNAAVPPLALRASQGPAAVVSGSCSTTTLAQVERMSASYPTFQVEALALGDGQDIVGKALAWASAHLPEVPVLVSASAPPEVVAQAQRELGTDRAAQLVEDALASIATGLLELGVTRLVVAGGETSGAVVNRLGIGEVRIGPPIAPGVPWIFPADRSELVLALKSGNFGGTGFFVEAVTARLASA